MQIAITGRNAALDASLALLNGGTLEIRTGAPAAVDTAPTGTVLAVLSINATAFAAAASGQATANAIVDVTAVADGDAGHYVAKNSSAAVERNGTAGVSGTDMILNNITFTTGDTVSVTAWTSSQPTN